MEEMNIFSAAEPKIWRGTIEGAADLQVQYQRLVKGWLASLGVATDD